MRIKENTGGGKKSCFFALTISIDTDKNLTQGFSKFTVFKTHLDIVGSTPRNFDFDYLRWGPKTAVNKYLTLIQLTNEPHIKQHL